MIKRDNVVTTDSKIAMYVSNAEKVRAKHGLGKRVKYYGS